MQQNTTKYCTIRVLNLKHNTYNRYKTKRYVALKTHVIFNQLTSESKIRIQKPFALSTRLFSKATEMITGVSKSVSPVDNVETLSQYL